MKRPGEIVLVAMVIMWFCAAESRADLTLAKNGGDACPIYFARPAESAAAQGLAKYLADITGAAFKAEAAPNTDKWPERAIIVGAAPSELPADLGADGFIIQTKGNRLLIAGGGPKGTAFGVFAFLRDYAGCHWWSRNEEDVPKHPTLSIGAIDITTRPAFEVHDLFNREAQSGENNFSDKSRAVSTVQFTGNHSLCPLLKPYVEKNPLFLPMNEKGERKWNDLHLNYTAPGMPEALAEALGKEVDARQGNVKDFIYFAGMGDWYGGMDLSPESKKIYDEETWVDADGVKKPGYTGTLLRMINRTAEILEKKYPGIRVGTFAYMSLEAPPAVTKPRDNVVIWIPRLRHDTVLSVEESDLNKSYRRNLERWCEITPGRVYIWEYGANYKTFLAPFPCLRSMADNIKLYRKLGVKGIMVQGNYVSTGGDMAVLKNYVWSRLLWDSNLETAKIVEEFCRGYYGPASTEMIAYVNAVEDSVRKPALIHANEFDEPRAKYLSDAVVARLRSILGDALARTTGNDADPFNRRVKEAMVSVESALLWTGGPLEEKDDKLIRGDLKEYVYPRALELVRHSREASKTEWSQGRSQRLAFLATAGGPLPSLTRGPLTVKVAPVQGEIWSVTWNGKEAMRQSVALPAAGAQSYEMIGNPTPSKVEMQAELGIGNWSADTKQVARQVVELTTDGAIHATVMGTAVNASADYKSMAVVVETTYTVGDDPTKIAIATRGADGAWQDASVSAAASQVERPGAMAVRITRAAEGVQVLDEYSVAKITTIKVTYDKQKGVIKTSVDAAPAALPAHGEGVVLKRMITVGTK